MDNPGSLRLFYALWPDDTVREALAGLQTPLQGRLTQRANLHLTLAFLGSQPASLLPALYEILDDLPAAPITLLVDRLGYFAQQRIAWAGMRQVPPALTALHAALDDRLNLLHIEFERPPSFRPHITLARNAAAPPDAPPAPILWQAGEVALVQSHSEDGAVRYRVLASRRLNERAG